MITPKTDWVISDTFEVEDFTRITENINEISSLMGVVTRQYHTPYMGEMYLEEDRTKLLEHYDELALLLSLPSIDEDYERTFLYYNSANLIESVVFTALEVAGRLRFFGQGDALGDGLVLGGLF